MGASDLGSNPSVPMSFMLGIDIGGSKILCVKLKGREVVRKQKKILRKKKREEILEIVRGFVEKFGEENVGIACPGILTKKKIIFSPNLPCLNGFNIVDYLEKRYGVKVLLENDANCFALGEYLRWKRDLVGITLGTGLGCGLVINGKLYEGLGNAGELGHTTIKFDGKICKCGRRGCAEEYFSERAFLRVSKRIVGKRYTPYQLAQMANRGREKALEVFRMMGRRLGIILSNVANLLNPELIVLGGGISKAWEFMRESCEEEMRKRCIGRVPRVVRGKEESGAVGAAYLFQVKR